MKYKTCYAYTNLIPTINYINITAAETVDMCVMVIICLF